ncbi:hypothetical protein OE749_02005 [Aestuariibacter sp. AA17]|uniref:Uncharacterized protein n=1 Tax=Fluctibacter corallii TaxID=2984329 RepID=A0ABT3A453_9ALTE|nr:hypothetical protein [Aestuariibacter sp. AA17]MCV2883470.1 hypothetical protein [Aestuariibacter sp. AA17]
MKKLIVAGTFLFGFVVSNAYSQSTPSEFAQLSLEDLLHVEFSELYPQSKWAISYQFKSVSYDDYLIGSRSLLNDELLWSGVAEERTSGNFPVVPTSIRQTAHVLSAKYALSSRSNLSFTLPVLSQSTEHISIISGYDQFTLESDGIGDVSLLVDYRVNEGDNPLRLSAGVLLPTGSIDKEGDTPRSPGKQPLPYTMQMGSGTLDITALIEKTWGSKTHITTGLKGVIRTGKNKRDYRLGNTVSVYMHLNTSMNASTTFSFSVEAEHSGPIRGSDSRLLVHSRFPYPASITNPNFYGGEKVRLGIDVVKTFSTSMQFNVGITIPVYQHLNGPQPKENSSFSLTLEKAF